MLEAITFKMYSFISVLFTFYLFSEFIVDFEFNNVQQIIFIQFSKYWMPAIVNICSVSGESAQLRSYWLFFFAIDLQLGFQVCFIPCEHYVYFIKHDGVILWLQDIKSNIIYSLLRSYYG